MKLFLYKILCHKLCKQNATYSSLSVNFIDVLPQDTQQSQETAIYENVYKETRKLLFVGSLHVTQAYMGIKADVKIEVKDHSFQTLMPEVVQQAIGNYTSTCIILHRTLITLCAD